MIKNIFKEILIPISILLNLITYFLSGFIKKKSNRVIIGSWSGHKISDNSRYFLIYLKETNLTNLEIICCGRRHLADDEIFNNSNIKFVRYNSLKSFYYAVTSKYVFITNTYRDISIINLFRNAIIVQLWHGFGLKNTLATKKEDSCIKRLYYLIGKKTYEKCDYFISSSELNTTKMLDTFKFHNVERSKILPIGQPKNDYLFKNNRQDYINNLKKIYKSKYNIPIEKKVILYLPTFRNNLSAYSFHNLFERERKHLFQILLDNNAIIIEKMHHKNLDNREENCSEFIFRVNSIEETQDLLLISDILITDYSSCFLDYLLLDKPIIHYAYDYHYYKNKDRGLYYDLNLLSGGPVVENFEELTIWINKFLLDNNLYHDRRQEIKKMAMNYELGNSSKSIVKLIQKNIEKNVGKS